MYTVQATGTAALHACFMRGNLPYCTQIPREKHAWNTRVKKYTQKYTRNTTKLGKFACKFLHAGCYNLNDHFIIFFLSRVIMHMYIIIVITGPRNDLFLNYWKSNSRFLLADWSFTVYLNHLKWKKISKKAFWKYYSRRPSWAKDY